MKKNCCDKKNTRLGKVGGQAVIEGVMMKAGEHAVTTCRKDDGSLVVTDRKFVSVRKKCKILNIPILRGIVNFIEMLALSVRTLAISADALDIDGSSKKKNEEKKKSSPLINVIMTISTIIGIALCVTLFIFLPKYLSGLLSRVVTLGLWEAVVEGGIKIVIFICYLLLVTLMKDIRRTFMYHGAEHKSIACFEAGEELTPENARKHKRFHPRCGTSFMFFMILIGIIAGLLLRIALPDLDNVPYVALRLAILPLVVGLGYEIIMLAGKHNNVVTRMLSAPGLWVQRITTKEPTDDMLEVAITSLKCALRDEYPEFMEFYQQKGWKKDSDSSEEQPDNTESTEGSEQPKPSENSEAVENTTEDSEIFETSSENSENTTEKLDTGAGS